MNDNIQLKIRQISTEIKEKLQLVRKKKRSNEDFNTLKEDIWNLSKRKFVLSSRTSQELKRYTGLIFTVGFSPEPIILNILANDPEAVFFIINNETRRTIDLIIKETNLAPSQYQIGEVNRDSAAEYYRIVKEALKYLIIKKGLEKEVIAMDPTGGTKILSLVCGIATVLYNVDLLYVKIGNFDPDLRHPEPGSEVLINIPKPIKIYKGDDVFESELNEKTYYWYFGVFLSYSTLDSEFFNIREIVKRLEKYPEIDKVFYWEKDSTQNIVQFMEENLTKCKVFVLFCSKNAKKSKSVQAEWQAAFQLKQEGKLKIIPIYFNPEHIPNLLKPFLNVKFSEKNFSEFVEKLYNEILR